MRFLILSLLVILGHCSVTWSTNNEMKMGGISLSEYPTLTKDKSPRIYNFTYDSNLTKDPFFKAISFAGFYAFPSYFFSFNLSIIQVTRQGFDILCTVEYDTMFILLNAYYFVAITGQNYGGVFAYTMFYSTFELQTIGGNDSKTQVFNDQSFTRIENNSQSMASAFSGFSLKNNNKRTPNLLQLKSWFDGDNLKHNVTTSCNNSVKYVVITTIQTMKDINYTYISRYFDETIKKAGELNLSRYNTQAFSAPNRIYLGIHSLFLNNSKRQFNYSLESNLTLIDNSLTIGSNDVVSISGFLYAFQACPSGQIYNEVTMECVTSCPPGTAPVKLLRQTCLPCAPQCQTCQSSNLSNCESCSTNAKRSNTTPLCSCLDGYVQVGTRECPLCQDYIPGCLKCTQTTVCTECRQQLSKINDICICDNNLNLVSGYCLEYKGCIRANKELNSINASCYECNESLNFKLQNLQCVCQDGYKLVGDQCSSICGDGKTIDEQCDDNGTEDGDGCSSTCTQQFGYICNYYAVHRTICLPLKQITLEYKYAQNPLYTNNVSIYFLISPTNLNLPQSFFNQLISTSISQFHIATYNPSTNALIINSLYDQTIEDTSQNITIQYNLKSLISQGFYTRDTTNQVFLQGINTQLIYKPSTQIYYFLQYYMYALTIIIFLTAFIFSIGNNKLIGLELIMPIQAIFYTMLCINQYRLQFSPLRHLKYLDGYNVLSSYTDIQNPKLRKLGLQQQFIYNHNIFIILIILILLMIILNFILKYKHWQLQKNNNIIDQCSLSNANQNSEENYDENQKFKNQTKNQAQNALIKKEFIVSQIQSLEYFQWLFYDRIIVFFIIITIQPALVFFIINLSVPPTQPFLAGISSSYCWIALMLIIGFTGYFMIESKEQNQRTIELTSQSRQYSKIMIISWSVLSIIIGISFSFSAYSLYYLLPLPLILIFLQTKFRPYQIQIQVFPDDANAYITMTIINYNTFVSLYNTVLYSVSIIVFIVLSFIQSENLTVALITISVLLSIIRFIRAFQLIDCQLFNEDNRIGKGLRKVIKKEFKKNKCLEKTLQEEFQKQNQQLHQNLVQAFRINPFQENENINQAASVDQQNNQLTAIKNKIRKSFRIKANQYL